MKPARVLASAAVSALGFGARLHRAAPVGERAESRVRTDAALAERGLSRPRVATVPAGLDDDGSLDPATRFLLAACQELLNELDARQVRFRTQRIGVALGTSTGGMWSLLEGLRAYESSGGVPRELAERSSYYAPFAAFVERLAVRPRRQAHVLAACASSTLAIGLGCRWLELGEVDLVICGGYDALNLLVCSGFESLGATTATTPAPFRVHRDGMALGEGAAVLALSLDDRPRPGVDCVLGFGASSDGFHVTAPKPTGAALARAAELALADAGLVARDIDLVSAHATATVSNDLAEARALSSLLGHGARPPVDAVKAVLGHTLGASGALEAVMTFENLREQLVPAVCGSGELIAELGCELPAVTRRGTLSRALKLSAGFGGCNATLVLGAPEPSAPSVQPRATCVECLGPFVTELDWEKLSEYGAVDPSRLRHADLAAQLALAAALGVVAAGHTLPSETAVVVASRTLGVAANRAFFVRLHERGVSGVAPRLFPNTSPNLCASQCGIAFGLSGPCFAVDEAPRGSRHVVDVASALVDSGQCEQLLLIAVEQRDEATCAIFEAAGWPAPEHGARALLLGPTRGQEDVALLDWGALRAPARNLFELIAALGHSAGVEAAAGE